VRRRQVLDYLVLGGVWGGSFVLVLRVVQVFGWVGAVAFRALTACVILAGLAVVTRRRLHFGSWRPLAVVGATTVAGQLVGLSVATPLIGTAMAAIFVGSIPLFAMAIAWLWGIERVTASGRLGLILGFLGVVLLVGFPSVPVTGSFVLGCAASLLGAVSAAVGTTYARGRLQAVGAWEQTIGAFFFGGLLTLPLLLVVPVAETPAVPDYLGLALLAGMCSALAYVLYFRLVAEVGATVATSVEFLVTVVAVAIGALLLRERLSVAQLLGGAAVITGCCLVLGLVPRRDQSVSAEITTREPG
jgi:drug/metabolite transporter (DMT)-like permease